MTHPDPHCDPTFWMLLERRLGRIERTLADGLTPEQVAELRHQVARLTAQLQNSRILLAGAIRGANRQLQVKGTKP